MKWTMLASWGVTGGWYIHNGYTKRICLGKLAFTFIPMDIDDIMIESMKANQCEDCA